MPPPHTSHAHSPGRRTLHPRPTPTPRFEEAPNENRFATPRFESQKKHWMFKTHSRVSKSEIWCKIRNLHQKIAPDTKIVGSGKNARAGVSVGGLNFQNILHY